MIETHPVMVVGQGTLPISEGGGGQQERHTLRLLYYIHGPSIKRESVKRRTLAMCFEWLYFGASSLDHRINNNTGTCGRYLCVVISK